MDSVQDAVQHAPELPAAYGENRAGCSVVESSVMMILLESCPAPKCVAEVSRRSSTFLTTFPLASTPAPLRPNLCSTLECRLKTTLDVGVSK